MNIGLLIWLFIVMLYFYFPEVLKPLSLFDNVVFNGVKVRATCTFGDPKVNARLLMCAWTISIIFTVYIFLRLQKDKEFYSNLICRVRVLETRILIGQYSHRRFKYYYIACLFLGLAYGYYYYMLAGYFDDISCSKFLADRALIIQGAVIVILGNFLGWLLAIVICKFKANFAQAIKK